MMSMMKMEIAIMKKKGSIMVGTIAKINFVAILNKVARYCLEPRKHIKISKMKNLK